MSEFPETAEDAVLTGQVPITRVCPVCLGQVCAHEETVVCGGDTSTEP